MSLILVEGLDRAGKTTRCRELMAEPRNKPRLMLHFVAPPTAHSVYDKRRASDLVLEEMMLAYRIAESCRHVDFVLDRGHVSWFAYDMLRGSDINVKRLRDVESQVHDLDVHVEYVEARDALTLARRDDGLSTYTPPKDCSPLQRLRLTADNIKKEAVFFEHVLALSSWPVVRRVTE